MLKKTMTCFVKCLCATQATCMYICTTHTAIHNVYIQQQYQRYVANTPVKLK